MRKKLWIVALAGVLSVTTFAGCGSKTAEDVTPTPTVEPTAAITVTVAPTATEVPEETPVPTETPEVTGAVEKTKVTLGQYKGLTLYEVDSSLIDQELLNSLQNYAELVAVDRAAVEGDIVNINYIGKKDGVAFEGGTDEEYDLELGSGSFIDGFESGLIGAVAGEVRDLNLTFPENYPSEDLAGQAVVFTVTVNAVQEIVTPELTDEFAKEKLGFDTVEEYVAALYQARNKEAFYDQITIALMDSSTVENYPVDKVENEKQLIIDYYISYVQMYTSYFGLDTKTALEYMGFESVEALESYAEEYAYSVIKCMIVLNEIAKLEKLTISEEEYQQRALIYAQENGYEDVASFEAECGAEAVFDTIITDYVMDYVISQANIVKAEDDEVVEQQ